MARVPCHWIGLQKRSSTNVINGVPDIHDCPPGGIAFGGDIEVDLPRRPVVEANKVFTPEEMEMRLRIYRERARLKLEVTSIGQRIDSIDDLMRVPDAA